MDRHTYRAQTRAEQPRHIAARALGANLTALHQISYATLNCDTALRAVWDYRAAGLTIDEARKLVQAWNRTSYHPRPISPEIGRYLRLRAQVATARQAQVAYFRRTVSVNQGDRDGPPTWDSPSVRLDVAGRTIITTRHEHVTWERKRRNHYPTSREVYYISQLLRQDWQAPFSAARVRDENLDGYTPDSISRGVTEREITHDLRGHWWTRVITLLLGAEAAASFRWQEHEATTYKIVESNGDLHSVYAPEFTYTLGEWVQETAKPNHNGGIYCYADADTAIQQAKGNEVFRREWTAGKTLVLCECSAKGRRIEYDNGKLAYSQLRINKILQAVVGGEASR